MSSYNNATLEGLISQFFQSIPAQESIDSNTFQPVLNNIGMLAIAAGENKRLGFQDVCLLVQESYSDIIANTGSLNEELYNLLQLWRNLAFNYIKDSKASTIESLTTFFTRPELNSSVDDNVIETLRETLIQESEQFPILFFGIIDAIKHNIPVAPSVLNNKLDRLIASLNENTLSGGFLDVASLFQENISDIADEKSVLTNNQNKLILNWLTQAEFFLADNNTGSASELIDILKDKDWPTPLTDVDANILSEMFGIAPVTETDTETQFNDNTSSTIPEALQGLCNQLHSATTQMRFDNTESIIDVANITEELGLASGELDLLAFQDVCLIVKENLSDMVSDNSIIIENYVPYIMQWESYVINYLSDTDDLDLAVSMLTYLADNQWPSPLAHADIDILKDMFGVVEQAENNMDITMIAPVDQMDSTIATTVDQLDLTVATTNEDIQQALNEILDDVIDTKDILATPRTISKDLVQMLREEAVMIQSEAQNQINLITEGEAEANIISDSLSQYALHIERFGNACQAAELDGLHQVSEVFSTNLNYFSKHQTNFTEHQLSLLSSWPVKVIAYLETPGDDACSDSLAQFLQDDVLPKKLMLGVAPALVNLLKAVYVSDKDVSKETRQTVAEAEDISIALPEDINQELLDGLLQELPGQTEEFSSAIQSFIDGSGDSSNVQKAQRVAHTVKGAANTVGVRGIATLTHHLEDILSALTELNRLPSPALANVFMEASDCLEEMSESLLERGSSPANSQEVLQSVLDWANRIESEGADCLTSEQGQASQAASSVNIKESEEKPADDSEADATLRVPAGLIDEVLRLLGETMIVTSQLQERVRLSTLQSQRLIEHQNMVQNLTSDLEVQVDVNGSSYNQQQAANQNEVFDSLELEEYNELHTVTHQIVEAAVDSYELNQEIATDLRELDELLIDKLRLHNEIQDLVMRTRMVPIKTITPRLQRIVRQVCRTTKKLSSLEIHGSDTLIDSNIINKLIDPLMHMIRNAIDHGIETREERIHQQKDPEGKLILTFFREGTQIVVRCQDDGAGLNHTAILEKAISHNLIKAEDNLSESEINRLILHSGFSTREKATQTSGRGVGLDVVHTELLALKGSVHIESQEGNGCLIELRMPVTLMSSHALLLRHLSQIIAVSNHGIEKILHPSDSQIFNTENGTYCEVDGEKLQMVSLESLLNLPEDRRNEDRDATRTALLIREEELNHVVYIQEVVDTRDLFIKSMGQYLNNIKGILGATILGDGSVVPVIDLPELIRAPVVNLHSPSELTQTNIHRALPIALVVDDSLSARRALAQVIQDAGFDVRTAKDGLEAVGIIEKKKPDIMLVDMEMPRMNGMELTSHVRGFPNTKDIPVIMVTSRSTDKHRKQAEDAGVDVYVTKPFSEDDLLDHVHELLN